MSGIDSWGLQDNPGDVDVLCVEVADACRGTGGREALFAGATLMEAMGD